jgi:hypothetical protein
MIAAELSWDEILEALSNERWGSWRDREAAAFVAYHRLATGRLPPRRRFNRIPPSVVRRLGYLADYARREARAPRNVRSYADRLHRALGAGDAERVVLMPGARSRDPSDLIEQRWGVAPGIDPTRLRVELPAILRTAKLNGIIA